MCGVGPIWINRFIGTFPLWWVFVCHLIFYAFFCLDFPFFPITFIIIIISCTRAWSCIVLQKNDFDEISTVFFSVCNYLSFYLLKQIDITIITWDDTCWRIVLWLIIKLKCVIQYLRSDFPPYIISVRFVIATTAILLLFTKRSWAPYA